MSATNRVVVVGGAGFIGTPLVRALRREGYEVAVVDRSRPADADVSWTECDVRATAPITDAFGGAHTVINLVGMHGIEDRPRADFDVVNVEGARSVAEAADRTGVRRIVFASTAAVYGSLDGPNETSPCRPVGAYGESKWAAEEVYRSWRGGEEDRELAIVRPTVVVGPGGGGAGQRLLQHAASVHARLRSGGQGRKSLAFVENLADFLAWVVARPDPDQLFNYADQPDLTLAEIFEAVRGALELPAAPSVSGPKAVLESVGRRLFPSGEAAQRAALTRRAAREVRFDAGLAHRSGFVQRHDLREALAETARSELGWLRLIPEERRP